MQPHEFAEELDALAEFHDGQHGAYQTWLDRFSDGRNKRSELDITQRTEQRDKSARTAEILRWMAGRYRQGKGTQG